ncbi:hypothetical protein, partial [Salmonella enterica]|uniref:hypothetical protein n=1 Tax=Salmonella enterica TaxID=28901 RepID=UPI003D281976
MTDQPDQSTAAEQKTARRRLLARGGLVALVVGGLYGAYAYVGYLNHGQYVQSTDDAYVKADGITV